MILIPIMFRINEMVKCISVKGDAIPTNRRSSKPESTKNVTFSITVIRTSVHNKLFQILCLSYKNSRQDEKQL